jgi:hypothetical protein
MVSRRRFLAAGSAVALAAGVAPTRILDRLSPTNAIPSDDLAHATFAGLEGTQFSLRTGMFRKQRLELVSVAGKNTTPKPGELEQFSLMFRGPASVPLGQETYQVDHDRIGSFSLFIVPVESAEHGHQLYEAVFNRLHA